jgi:hypothetical protein
MDSVERAIGCCYEAADKDWRIMAERRIAQLAMRKMPFTSEDIIRYLEYRGLETPDMRALGGIFLKYANSKEIKSVGWTIATRKERHNAPIRVWRGA